MSMFLTSSRYNQGNTVNALLLEKNVHYKKMLADRTALRQSTMTTVAPRSRSIAFQPGHPFSSIRRDAGNKDTEAEPISKSELGRAFVDEIEESLKNNNFVSLMLQGVKKKKGKKIEGADDLLRGSIRQVQGRLIMVASKKKKKNSDSETLLLQLTLKYHGATDVCKNFPPEDVPKTIYDLILGDPTEMYSPNCFCGLVHRVFLPTSSDPLAFTALR